MSNPYNSNQSWNQQQPVFGQSHQPPQMKEFDFTTLSGSSDDRQSQSTYTYHPSQLQLPSGGGSSPSMVHPFSNSQPQSRSSSFGNSGNLSQANPTTFPSFGSSTNQSQNVESYDTLFPVSSPEQMSWSDSNNAFHFGKPIPDTNFNVSGFGSAAESTYLANRHLSTSPSAMQDTFPQPSQYTPKPPDPRAKRPRSHDEIKDDEQDGDNVPDTKDGAKAAKSGACQRCKTLKVKCEFKTDTDPCKRCMNGGHDCVIPGRKKRRTPPKREHLLNQIREQATQIKDLMSQLEVPGSNSRYGRPSSSTSDSFPDSTAIRSPVLSTSGTHDSYVSADAPRSSDDVEASKAVEDWIAKAKQSFKEFDVFIGIGGAGIPKNYLLDEDLEDPDSDSDDDFVNISDNENSDYEFAIEHPDGENTKRNQGVDSLRHQGSSSSLSTNGTGLPGLVRKKHSGERAVLAGLSNSAAPFELFHNLSIKSRPKKRGSSSDIEEEKLPGIANPIFFRSMPAPEAMNKRLENIQHPPQILTRQIITPQEAEELFRIYFERMNLSVSLLDPVLYTAQKTCYRSPFLFTVICAIASRFYARRPELYTQVMQYAQQAAGFALIAGHKNVEMCQAYILLSLYPVPARRWEDQRSWLYLGLAIRTATDLNLHLPNTAKPVNEAHAREMLNRTRVWLNCFNLDRSTGSQFGKPPIINPADYMANHSEDWWRSSEYNIKNFDIHICAYNAELKVVAGFIAKIYSDRDHPTGLNTEVDFEKIATETDEELQQLGRKWLAILDTTDMTDPQNSFRTGLLQLAYPYARLVALSYGFQHAFGKSHTDENPFLTRCLTAAFDVVNPVLNDLCRPGQRIFFRHGPEAQSVFVTFASAFLVKLLQPKFASYLTIEKRLEIREVVQKVVDLLSSAEIASDDRHGPGLYAKFIKGLLAAPMAQVDPMSPSAPPKKSRMSSANPRTTDSNYSHSAPAAKSPLSRASSASLSPAPRQEALSFETFTPAGATDPFAPSLMSGTNSLALHLAGAGDGSSNPMHNFFQPPLPFDDAIMNGIQALDSTAWQDIPLANFSWEAFQQPLDMDFRTQEAIPYSGSFMRGVQQ